MFLKLSHTLHFTGLFIFRAISPPPFARVLLTLIGIFPRCILYPLFHFALEPRSSTGELGEIQISLEDMLVVSNAFRKILTPTKTIHMNTKNYGLLVKPGTFVQARKIPWSDTTFTEGRELFRIYFKWWPRRGKRLDSRRWWSSSVGRSVGLSIGRSVSLSASRSVGRSVGQFFGQSCSVSRSSPLLTTQTIRQVLQAQHDRLPWILIPNLALIRSLWLMSHSDKMFCMCDIPLFKQNK